MIPNGPIYPNLLFWVTTNCSLRDIQGRDERVKGQRQNTTGRKGDLRIRDVPVLKEPDQEPFPETLRIVDPDPVLIGPDLPG